MVMWFGFCGSRWSCFLIYDMLRLLVFWSLLRCCIWSFWCIWRSFLWWDFLKVFFFVGLIVLGLLSFGRFWRLVIVFSLLLRGLSCLLRELKSLLWRVKRGILGIFWWMRIWRDRVFKKIMMWGCYGLILLIC